MMAQNVPSATRSFGYGKLLFKVYAFVPSAKKVIALRVNP